MKRWPFGKGEVVAEMDVKNRTVGFLIVIFKGDPVMPGLPSVGRTMAT